MGPGEPLRAPYGLPVSAWEWWVAQKRDPGCMSVAKTTPDDIPELVEDPEATASPVRTPERAEAAPALAGDPGNTVSAHHPRT